MLYRHIENGLPGELGALPHEAVVDHLRNYLGNFYLDPGIAAIYINRLGAVPPEAATPRIQSWQRYLVKKYAQLRTLDADILKLTAQLDPTAAERLAALKKCALEEPLARKVAALPQEEESKGYALARQLFVDYPYSPAIMEYMLLAELRLNIPAAESWRKAVALPPALRPYFDFMLMQIRLAQGNAAGARELYDSNPGFFPDAWPDDWPDAWRLIIAAETLAQTGDREQALTLYRRAYQLDPSQMAAKYRIEELAHPLKPDRELLHSRVAVCLYSWNKSELLQASLRSLAASEIAGASVLVLLNGCTDDSFAAVSALNRELFNGRIEIIQLPVNVGAPAARNWLLASKSCREADYVAFWDDDVKVQPYWLPLLLTVLRSNPKAGVAGAKILSPGRPRRLQYAYRNISVAQKGLLRLSLDAPAFNYDCGFYDFTRPTGSVMGCCHVFTRAACDAEPAFDLRFSPSQMDDICHDLDLRLKGFGVMYCGLVACEHFQMSGVGRATRIDLAKYGQVWGNDVKFYYRFANRLPQMKTLGNLAEAPDLPL
jgi:GT2 family glycosyltransferase